MWFWRSGAELGIDLGTATVLVYEKGKGIILKDTREGTTYEVIK